MSNPAEQHRHGAGATGGARIDSVAAIGSSTAGAPMTMGRSAPPAATATLAKPNKLGPENFFADGRPIPPRSERISASLAAIDWSRRDIVLWVPGTSETEVPAAFAQAVQGAFGGVSPVAVRYLATWRFSESLPDGEAMLTAVLQEIQRRNRSLPPSRRHRVFLMGQSQGAWIISNVLERMGIGGLVQRAVLFGHPGFADTHHHDRNPHVLEINNPGDHVTMPTSAPDELVLTGVERLSSLQPSGLWMLARAAVRDPGYLWLAIASQLTKLRPGEAGRDPHDYSSDARAGAIFLATGRRIGRARHRNDANGTTPR